MYNIGFYPEIRYDTFDEDLKCPKCQTNIDIVWKTEYGEPNFGEHRCRCPSPKCQEIFTFSVFPKYAVH